MTTKTEQQKSVDQGAKPQFDHDKENSNFDKAQHGGNLDNPKDAAYEKKHRYSK